MPIKLENRKLYPPDWKKIRAAILDRAGHKCEQCRVPNHAIAIRFQDAEYAGSWAEYDTGRVYDVDGNHIATIKGSESPEYRLVRIVLTVAHLDHDPTSNDPSNLRALCQRCHLVNDVAHHQESAKATRYKRKCENQGSLLEALNGKC
jgi:5-methylcytosine-specific restriction endonuclease McrA